MIVGKGIGSFVEAKEICYCQSSRSSLLLPYHVVRWSIYHMLGKSAQGEQDLTCAKIGSHARLSLSFGRYSEYILVVKFNESLSQSASDSLGIGKLQLHIHTIVD